MNNSKLFVSGICLLVLALAAPLTAEAQRGGGGRGGGGSHGGMSRGGFSRGGMAAGGFSRAGMARSGANWNRSGNWNGGRNWNGRNWSGNNWRGNNWRGHHHNGNDVIFIGSFGVPVGGRLGLWAWLGGGGWRGLRLSILRLLPLRLWWRVRLRVRLR